MMPKDSWTKRINTMQMHRLEEQARALYRQGRYTEAARVSENILRTAVEAYGPDHPYVTACRNNLAHIGKALQKETAGLSAGMPRGGNGKSAQRGVGRRFGFYKAVAALIIVFFITAGFADRYSDSGISDGGSVYASTSGYLDIDSDRPFYRVKAAFYPRQKTVEGEEEAVFVCREPMDEVAFDLYFNRYRDRSLDNSEIRKYALTRGRDSGGIDIHWVTYRGKPVRFKQEGQLLRVFPAEGRFEVGEHSLSLGFRVRVPYIADRSGGTDAGIWLGNWLPTLKVAPGQNRPTEIGDPYVNHSATYEVEFSIPGDYALALSNMDKAEAEGNRHIYKGTLERVRDLPVFLNKAYQAASITQNGIRINYYSISGRSRSGEVLKAAGEAVQFYLSKVGEYPWEELNIVENDMYLNGMEYSTMVLISSKALQSSMRETIFHEIGHQWFYNIIGSDQYHASYIDEGAVEFLASYGLNGRTPVYRQNVGSLNRGLDEFRSWPEYRGVHYHNGKKLFENLYVIMGKTEFESFIKEYYHRYKHGLVTREEFRMLVAGKIGEEEARRLLD